MANPSPPRAARTSRAEKLSILSALLGPDALARLREGLPDEPDKTRQAPVAVDADRAAWHHNKLLERLREQGTAAQASKPATESATAPRATVAPSSEAPLRPRSEPKTSEIHIPGRSLDIRLAALADVATLANEHPAIVTRLIRTLAREDRVAVLKSLPGPLARSVVKRLR